MGFNNPAYCLRIIISKAIMAEQLIKELRKGNPAKIKDMLDGPPVNWNTFDKKSGRNILQLAIESEDPEVFRLILNAPGVTLNTPDKDNNETPLQTAILINNAEFVEALLDKNANPFQANKEGLNAVHTAVLENLPRMLETMARRNIDINSVKCIQGSLLNLAIKNGRAQTAIWLLTDKNSKVNLTAKDKFSNNCLLLAVKENLTSVVDLVLDFIERSEMSALEKELFMNTQDENGDTDLQSVIMMLTTRGMGLNPQLKNLKKETIKDINLKRVQAKEMEVKNQEKARETKKMKEQEKHAQRQREIEKQKEEELQKKREQKLLKELQIKKAVEQKESEKKTRWYILVGVIVAVVALYFWLDWAITNRRNNAGLII